MESKESKQKKTNLCIPDDITFNILRRLHPKSLVRFKFACKSWQSFVDQHKYHTRKLILHSYSSIQSVDFEADEIKAVDLDIPFTGTEVYMPTIASCNGLLCVLVQDEGLVVWNPILGIYKWIVPRFHLPDFENFGFWFDHSTNSYMIVGFMMVYDDIENPLRSSCLVDIYSQKTNTWQRKESLSWRIDSIDTESGFLVKEAIYWSISYFKENSNRTSSAILCYDTLQETFDVIQPPDEVDVFDILGDIKGCLCISYENEEGNVELWTRKVGNSRKWFKFTSFPPFEAILQLDGYLEPLCFMKNDEILVNVRGNCFGLIRLNRRKQFFFYCPEVHRVFEIADTNLEFHKVIAYAETLVLP